MTSCSSAAAWTTLTRRCSASAVASRAATLDQRVGPFEADECNRHGAMFRHAAAGQHVRANRRRQAPRDRLVRHRGTRPQRQFFGMARWRAPKEHAGALAVSQATAGQQRGRFGAEQDLAGVCRLFHCNKAAPSGSGGQQLDVRCADRKEMEFAGVHGLRHPQRDPRAWHFDATDIAQYPAHLQRRTAGTRDVALGREPEQQRVAAELEQAATIIVGDLQDRFETAPDRIRDLLRTFAALAREPFRQLRESRDVDEHCAAVTRPEACVRVVDQMLLEDPRDVAARFSDIGLGPLRRRVFRV